METRVEDRPGNNASEQSEGAGLETSKNLEASGTSSSTNPSAARITIIDISSPARALAVLRWSDYALVFLCGIWALKALIGLLTRGLSTEWSSLGTAGAMIAVLAFSAYTGWRHIGVIDHRVWSSYLWVLPSLTTLCFWVALLTVVDLVSASQGQPSVDLPAFFNYLQERAMDVGRVLTITLVIIPLIPVFASVLFLRRVHITPMGVRLVDLLASLTKLSGMSGLRLSSIPMAGVGRGFTYVICGAALLIGVAYSPDFLDVRQEHDRNLLRWVEQLNVLGFFLIVRARRYFQVSADSLLAVDKRPPVLFLRSFSDDEKQLYRNSQRAIFDFSLETRLANHFYKFGPFIAIGSPRDDLPQPGAARVILPDDQWQPRVLGWMKEASVIIMYAGTTEWVNWELRKIVECSRSTRLILMFPETKLWRSSRRKRDTATRVEHICEVYKDTLWEEELKEYCDFANVRAMLFFADGSMMMIRSRSRSRDAYHLAALVAHYVLLHPSNTQMSTVNDAEDNGLRWTSALAWALSGFMALGAGLYWLALDDETKLTFKRSELYYTEPVTRAVASSVGEHLVRQHFFSDETAATVKLIQKEERYQLGFVINPAHSEKLWIAIQFGVMGSDIGREVLAGKPIDVALYDQQLKLIKIVPASARLLYGKGELYYTDPINVNEAQAMGSWLMQSGFFSESRATAVHFGREQGVYQFRFVVDPSILDDPQVTDAFIELSRAIAAQVLGGEAMLVHLCDGEFQTLKSTRVEPVQKQD